MGVGEVHRYAMGIRARTFHPAYAVPITDDAGQGFLRKVLRKMNVPGVETQTANKARELALAEGGQAIVA